MLDIIASNDVGAIDKLLHARSASLTEAEAAVYPILADIRRSGDRALFRYAKKFDGIDLSRAGLTVPNEEIRRAHLTVSPAFIAAIKVAAANIRKVARRQLPRDWSCTTRAGVSIRQITRPLERVACYIPGGRFPLPSTVLMSVIPAQEAGVGEVFVTSPRPAPAVLVAADLLGVSKVYRLGGAQGIAAFAFGTESVPRVDKIVGPGNRYVAAAKKLVAGECAIDFIAGPSELVLVGTRGNPEWIAADLVAQAEHDTDAVAIFITPSRKLALKVQTAVRGIVARLDLPVAGQALASQGGIIVTRNLREAGELVNRLAPEHLTLFEGAKELLNRIQSAGSIFLGQYSPVAAGDYASGTNHILPTSGAARLRGGLNAADFVKMISVQRLTSDGLSGLKKTLVTLANAEGLKAHAYSVETRFSKQCADRQALGPRITARDTVGDARKNR
jgi:histidinol dehydrogenase